MHIRIAVAIFVHIVDDSVDDTIAVVVRHPTVTVGVRPLVTGAEVSILVNPRYQGRALAKEENGVLHFPAGRQQRGLVSAQSAGPVKDPHVPVDEPLQTFKPDSLSAGSVGMGWLPAAQRH